MQIKLFPLPAHVLVLVLMFSVPVILESAVLSQFTYLVVDGVVMNSGCTHDF